MNDDELERIADSLERSITGEPQSRLSRGKPWPWLSLNHDGCIAFAANLLRLAAKSPRDDGADVTQQLVGIDQINEDDDGLEIFLLRRTETVAREPIQDSDSPRLRDRVALLGCGIAAFFLGSIFLSGIYFWWTLIFAAN